MTKESNQNTNFHERAYNSYRDLIDRLKKLFVEKTRSDNVLVKEKETVEQLNPQKAYMWEDSFFRLQVGETRLVGLNNMESSTVGSVGFTFLQNIVIELREGRHDAKNNPIIYCVDQVSENEIFENLSPNDFLQAFDFAFKRLTWPKRYEDSWLIFLLSVGATLLLGFGIVDDFDDALNYLQTSDVNESIRNLLFEVNAHAVEELQAEITAYITDFQNGFSREEELYLKTGIQAQQYNGQSIEIEKTEYKGVDSQEYSVFLSPEDEAMMKPLFNAVKRGRHEMIKQAKFFAHLYCGASEEQVSRTNPPDWWINAESGESLRSDEILIYFPYKNDQEVLNMRKIFSKLYRIEEKNLLVSGWFLLRFNLDAAMPILTLQSKLH